MKVKLLRKFHRNWRHKITDDGRVILLDDIENIGYEYSSIHNFMDQYFVCEYFGMSTYVTWRRKKNIINHKNEYKKIYNENK